MILLVLSIFLGALGQFFFKLGANQFKNQENIISFYKSIFTNGFAWLGIISYGVSLILWFKILSKHNLSFVRPLVGIGYILSALLAWAFLGEKINPIHWVGIILIVTGVALIGFSNKGINL